MKLGQERLEKIIAYGTEGGMNNFSDIMTEQENQGHGDLHHDGTAKTS